jgi:hypothetical protein
MPSIKVSDDEISLDTFRQNPGGIYFLDELAKAKMVESYDGFHRAVKRSGIPLLKVGRRLGIEGRHALRLVGAAATIPEPESGEQPAKAA